MKLARWKKLTATTDSTGAPRVRELLVSSSFTIALSIQRCCNAPASAAVRCYWIVRPTAKCPIREKIVAWMRGRRAWHSSRWVYSWISSFITQHFSSFNDVQFFSLSQTPTLFSESEETPTTILPSYSTYFLAIVERFSLNDLSLDSTAMNEMKYKCTHKNPMTFLPFYYVLLDTILYVE